MATTLQYLRAGTIATGVYNPVWFSGPNTLKVGHKYLYTMSYTRNDATTGSVNGEVIQSANTYGLLDIGFLLDSISSYHNDFTPAGDSISLPKQGGVFSLSVGESYIWSDSGNGYSNSGGNVQITLSVAQVLTGEWLIVTDANNFAQPLIAKVLSSSGTTVVIDYPYASLTANPSAWTATTASNLRVTVANTNLVTNRIFIKGGDVLDSDNNPLAIIRALSLGTNIQGYGTTNMVTLPVNDYSLFAINVQQDTANIRVSRDGVASGNIAITNNVQVVVRSDVHQNRQARITNTTNGNRLDFAFQEVDGCEDDNLVFFDRGGNVLSIPCRVKATKMSAPTKTKYTNDYRPFGWTGATDENNRTIGNTRTVANTQAGHITIDLCTLTSEQAEVVLHELINSPKVYYKKGASLANACEIVTSSVDTNRRNYLVNVTMEIKLNQTRSAC